ncbi:MULTISPECIES: TRAP transporter substrate-binding protein [unclassified Uliginosibacterium]|uniref:TRAP transporter substrate-binding protein n=1 Tax=unclassified Uliginosibacterium TaxID=2621521 RepID=UPI000C7BB3C0|nr:MULTISPECIES: TRAP transporter substrate-binding protein [unclassified Uliginosibacterium]MDO6384800.1 TRAP transporter substrate-binding protein [Uliginosibacterium sp. 31-12]PLK48486.1 C4-dicarboxylate ABC transporter [Uliginosibacterium sp. TH139]
MNIRRTLLLGLMALATSPLAFAQQPIVIKFSHVVAKDTPKGKAADQFAKLVNERAAGKLKVEVYPNSQLYKDGEEMNAIQLGAVQMLAPSLAKFGPLGVREFELFDLPFIFDDYNALHRITNGPVGASLLKKLEPKGIVGLAYWDNGFKDFSANRLTKKPEDFKGLKMRIQSSKVLESQMRSLGVIPQVMAFSEVYQALQTGVVDGTENPPSNFYTQKMHEVQKYMVQSHHGYLGYAVIINKKFWDELSPDLKKIVSSAMDESTRYANAIALKENADATDAVKASGKTQVVALSPAERSELKKVMVKVHKEQESRIGTELIKSVYKETGFDPAKP